MPDRLTSDAPLRVRKALTAIDCALDSINAATRELTELDPWTAAKYEKGLRRLGAAGQAARATYHALAAGPAPYTPDARD